MKNRKITYTVGRIPECRGDGVRPWARHGVAPIRDSQHVQVVGQRVRVNLKNANIATTRTLTAYQAEPAGFTEAEILQQHVCLLSDRHDYMRQPCCSTVYTVLRASGVSMTRITRGVVVAGFA